MNAAVTPLLLLVAACLEVGGDAIVRIGLKHCTGFAQLVFGIRPGLPMLVGGARIAAGGLVISIWKD